MMSRIHIVKPELRLRPMPSEPLPAFAIPVLRRNGASAPLPT